MTDNPILQEIGNTPIIELDIKSRGTFYGKLEFLNPGGSIKDRAALYMIQHAEKEGLLKPGGTIIEGSSGNQGIALAMIGAVKGYRVIITVPERTSIEKVQTLRAYGAEVHVCPNTEDHDAPDSYHMRAVELTKTIDGAFMPDQYYNPLNAEAHYQTTGPEIWKQTDGKITHFICGAGSCGTISGVGAYLKEQNSDVQIIGVDSAQSLYSASSPGSYNTEGIGIDVISEVFRQDVVDEIIPIEDAPAFETARNAAKKGLMVGLSCGAVLYVAEAIKERLKPDDIAVCILADSGRAYLSKLYS